MTRSDHPGAELTLVPSTSQLADGPLEFRKVPVDDIVVGERHRSDLGDITSLADSIATTGLINSLAVTPDMRLIAGGRRLAAIRTLGWRVAPVQIHTNITSAAEMLVAERDENNCRKEMTPSEKVAIGQALEELERPAAAERMVGGTAKDPRKNFPRVPTEKGRTVDIVGKALGMSGPTYSRAKSVAAAAAGTTPDGQPLPAEVQGVAEEALAEMDRSGKVTPAYDKVMNARSAAGCASTNGKKPAQPKPPPRMGGNRRKHADVIDAMTIGISGFVIALDGVDRLDDSVTKEEAARLSDDLSKAMKTLRQIHNLIKERTQ